MKKKILSMLLAASMVATLGACGSNTDNTSKTEKASSAEKKADDPVQALIKNTKGTVDLTVWCSETEQYQNAMKEIVDSFKQKYSDVDFNITIGSESEANCKDDVLKDVQEAADIFIFPDDQLKGLVEAGALQSVDATYTYDPKETNSEMTVDAASMNGKLYAYPLTSSNGYFLFYDKNVFSEDDVKTMDGMLEKAAEKGKTVGMEVSGAWYLYSFFKGAGLDLDMNDDGTNSCNWNATDTKYKGTDVAKAITEICKNKAFKNCVNEDAQADALNGKMAADVNGTWATDAFKKAYGDGFAAAKLPTYTVNGDQVQMASFRGYKFVGVNAYSKQTGWAMLLAEYITSQENQTKIYEATGEGPANTEALKSASSPALDALDAQSQYAYLRRVGNEYWTPAASLGQNLVEGKYSDAQKLLDDAVKGITKKAS